MKRRSQLAHTRVRVNEKTSAFRTLPQLLVVGAQRSGTSSLYKYLGSHPDVAPSIRKETDYFTVRYAEGEKWYRAHFPLSGLAPTVSFEATPDYLLDPRAAGRAADLLPQAKIIAILRDPVNRALSQYEHNRRLGQEPLGFEEALEAEEGRVAGEFDRLNNDPTYLARPLRRYSYVTRGKYAKQLALWRQYYPEDQMLVLRFEDFVADAASVLGDVERFLNIREWTPSEMANHSYGRTGRQSGQAMAPLVREMLAQTFEPHNRQLETMLGRRFFWDDSGISGTSPS
jgi:hypothetical protein